ncbi:MAG: hypothetical protein Q4C95_02670 [Planctomycetia bacterium]|nr:hypothetical protein [Planctomycetia bacterium]
MKKIFILSALLLIAALVATGCSSMSSCFRNNGSRVPTVSSGMSGSSIAEFPVSAPVEQVIYSSPMNQCNPCTPACANPCDPCSTGGGMTANYPGIGS